MIDEHAQETKISSGRYRKRPVVVDAIRVNDALCHGLPAWLIAAHDAGTVSITPLSISIRTLEGTMRAGCDDWIIRGVAGELYPCKPDVFERTYEPESAGQDRRSIQRDVIDKVNEALKYRPSTLPLTKRFAKETK